VHAIRPCRTLVALLTIAIVAGSAVLPQLHEHVTRDAEGRLRVVVHQHWAAHHVGSSHGPSLDDEDGATYFNQSILVASPFNHAAPALAAAIDLGSDGEAGFVARPRDSASWPHGPPRTPASLRAPPRTA
jgi:hypothetical protein